MNKGKDVLDKITTGESIDWDELDKYFNKLDQGMKKLGETIEKLFEEVNKEPDIVINKGNFKNEREFSENDRSVLINGGEFSGYGAFYQQSGIVKVDGGEFSGKNAFLWQRGIVNVNGGEFSGSDPFKYQSGYVKISENAKFDKSIADSMNNGFLYVMNNHVKIGSSEDPLIRGLVIAPNGLKEVHNGGAAVFVVDDDKEYKNAIKFTGKVKIKGNVYTSSEILKSLGDYVWGNTTTLYRSIDSEERPDLKFVHDLADKYAGKEMEINLSELFKGIEVKAGELGKLTYERLKEWGKNRSK